MEIKYIPTRKCISCQKKGSKYELIRIVKTSDGFSPDPKNILEGRGAYVCKNDECILNLEKKSALARAFKRKVLHEEYEKLTQEIKKI